MKFFKKKTLNIAFILWSLFYLAVFSYILYISFHYLDHDFPWHLRIGEQISREGAAPTVDYYNHTMEGKTFIDHEWLFNWIFFQIYDKSGFVALNILFASILTFTLLALNYLVKKFYIDRKFSLFHHSSSAKLMAILMAIEACLVIAMKPFYGVRMQILGNFIFLLLLILLKLWNKTKKIVFLIFLIPLFILWANLHGSFLIGLAIMWAYIACKALVLILQKYKFEFFKATKLSPKELLSGAAVSFLATAATMANPYGIHLYSFLSGYKNTAYMEIITEWRPFFYLPLNYGMIIYMAIFVSVLLISLYIYTSKKNGIHEIKKHIKNPDLWHWSLALLFLILSFKSKRHFPLFFITSLPLVAQFIYFEVASAIKIRSARIKLFLTSIAIGFLAFVSIYHFSNTNFTNNPFNKHYSPLAPYELSLFIKGMENLPEKRIFNDYSFGGYFLWTVPEAKIFIDGRMPQANYEGHTLIEEYLDFYKEGQAEKMLKKHNIDLVILEKEPDTKLSDLEQKFFRLDQEEINKTPNHLRDYLMNSDEWKMIYEDEIGEVYSIKNEE